MPRGPPSLWESVANLAQAQMFALATIKKRLGHTRVGAVKPMGVVFAERQARLCFLEISIIQSAAKLRSPTECGATSLSVFRQNPSSSIQLIAETFVRMLIG